jgi:uncharacterized HAD superfamily protein
MTYQQVINSSEGEEWKNCNKWWIKKKKICYDNKVMEVIENILIDGPNLIGSKWVFAEKG